MANQKIQEHDTSPVVFLSSVADSGEGHNLANDGVKKWWTCRCITMLESFVSAIDDYSWWFSVCDAGERGCSRSLHGMLPFSIRGAGIVFKLGLVS